MHTRLSASVGSVFPFKLLVSVAVASVLVACGGGGGSGDSPSVTAPTVPTQPTTPPVTPGDLQTTVPALTYQPSSQEFEFVSALNDFRSRLGLGLLAQNTLLDKASANHLLYLLTNDANNGGTVNLNGIDQATGRSNLHVENGSLAKFTGIQESDRAKFVGYLGYAGEEVGFGGGQGGAAILRTLVQTVYHRAGLALQNVREIGVAVGGDKSQTLVMELGMKTPQSVASNYIGVYPSPGQTGVDLHAYVETPNPLPTLSTANDDFPTKTSFPLSVSIADGHAINVTSFSVTESGQSSPLDGRVLTRSNDPNNYLTGNHAFWIGNAPFKSATTYNIKFVGTNDGVSFTREWSFVTK
jgi:uncharacterized protein YkwD